VVGIDRRMKVPRHYLVVRPRREKRANSLHVTSDLITLVVYRSLQLSTAWLHGLEDQRSAWVEADDDLLQW